MHNRVNEHRATEVQTHERYNTMIHYTYLTSFDSKKIMHREDMGDGRGDKAVGARMPSGQVLLGSWDSCFSRGAVWLTRGRNGGRDLGGRGRRGNECGSPRLCGFK